MNESDLEAVRRAWRDANLVPLWESPTAHKPPPAPDEAQHWAWDQIRPLLGEAMKITSPDVVERRVLSLVNPRRRYDDDEATARTLAAAMQVLMPGERARPHRHTMNALRFVLEGQGATTFVDRKPCRMERHDLILTPAWTWHEHAHEGSEPVVWLDVLDVPLHLWLGNVVFQPGPINDGPRTIPDQAFACANVLPVLDQEYSKPYSPVYRYPYADAVSALGAAPRMSDGTRRIRYVNPLSGQGAMSLMDMTLMEIEKGIPTMLARTNANVVCCVAEGHGETTVGAKVIRWSANDVFTVPQNNWTSHCAHSDHARLLVVTDRDMLNRLGILREEKIPSQV
ncbi:cupin domain-containing protein [Paraburkholderia phymatum]|uniref:cupin domain-containing protein n=1 Tax=Paraburkholderia phymatum TaxID=148447 RepID=UPI0031708E7B